MLMHFINPIQMVILRALISRVYEIASQQPSHVYNRNPGHPTDFSEMIEQAAQRYNLDPSVIKAVIKSESNFKPQAVSSAGAQGLMQLMPGTAQSLGVQNSFDPAQNINGGAKYLRQMLNKFDSLPIALAAYNAGPGAVSKYQGIPPYQETQTYVKRVMNYVDQYREWEA